MYRTALYFLTLLLVMSFSSPATSAEGRKTYTNSTYRFTFDYPSSCEVKGLSKWYFDLLSEGEMLLRGSVEDETFKIFVNESKLQKDIFIAFARERARVVCGADGPHATVNR